MPSILCVETSKGGCIGGWEFTGSRPRPPVSGPHDRVLYHAATGDAIVWAAGVSQGTRVGGRGVRWCRLVHPIGYRSQLFCTRRYRFFPRVPQRPK